jgi:hypothetical protein
MTVVLDTNALVWAFERSNLLGGRADKLRWRLTVFLVSRPMSCNTFTPTRLTG